MSKGATGPIALHALWTKNRQKKQVIPFELVGRFPILEDCFASGENGLIYSSVQCENINNFALRHKLQLTTLLVFFQYHTSIDHYVIWLSWCKLPLIITSLSFFCLSRYHAQESIFKNETLLSLLQFLFRMTHFHSFFCFSVPWSRRFWPSLRTMEINRWFCKQHVLPYNSWL